MQRRIRKGACGMAKYDMCIKPADKDRAAGLCEEHTGEWLRSPEWREAIADEGVRFATSLSEKLGRKELGKFKRRWMKRVSESGESLEE